MDFFNQLKLAPQEHWKQNLAWRDLLAHAESECKLDLVSERLCLVNLKSDEHLRRSHIH